MTSSGDTTNAPKKPIEGLTVHAVDRVEGAIDVVRGLA